MVYQQAMTRRGTDDLAKITQRGMIQMSDDKAASAEDHSGRRTGDLRTADTVRVLLDFEAAKGREVLEHR